MNLGGYEDSDSEQDGKEKQSPRLSYTLPKVNSAPVVDLVPFSAEEVSDQRELTTSDHSFLSMSGTVTRHEMDDYVFEHNYHQHMSSKGSKRKIRRKSQGRAEDVDGFAGPWASVIEDEPSDVEEAEEFVQESKPVKPTEESETVKVDELKETSTFHGEELYDYQGRSYLHPPSAVRPKSHRCYIPKRCIHTWNGHSKAVSKIQFFPEYGHLMLSCSMDSTIRLWDVHNQRKCIRTFYGHEEGVKDVTFNNDGSRFLSASFDKYLKLWDTETGQCISRFTNGRSIPNCVQFHPVRQNEFLAGYHDKSILGWDIESGKPKGRYKEHLGSINSLTFLENGRRFLSTSADKRMMIWEYGAPIVIKQLSEPWMHSVPTVAVHPSGGHLAAQSLDNQIHTYQCRGKFKHEKKRVFIGHQCAGYAAQIGFSPDGRFLVSGDAQGRCFFWDWNKQTLLSQFDAHDKVTIGVQWHPIEPSRVATCSWDGTIKYWD